MTTTTGAASPLSEASCPATTAHEVAADPLRDLLIDDIRASNVISHVSGSGLGLAGARQIVVAHRGTILLERQIGSGTTLTVRLPLGVPTP